MYLITITITCNHKNQWLQITFRLLKTCNQLHVIKITDYNYNRSDYSKIGLFAIFQVIKNFLSEADKLGFTAVFRSETMLE